MTMLLLADTVPGFEKTVHEVEAMCHEAGLGLMIHHEGEDLDDILDHARIKAVVFSPQGELTLDEMVEKYGRDVLLVVGGFTEERDFKSDVYARADATVSLGGDFLPIPEVIKRIIQAYEKKAERAGD